MKYSRNKMIQAMLMNSKSVHHLQVGAELELLEIHEHEHTSGRCDDILIFKCNGEYITIKMRTMLAKHQCEKFYKITGQNEVELASKIKIVAMDDRMTRDAEKIYPMFCYNGYDQMMYKYGEMPEDEFMKELMYTGIQERYINEECKKHVTFEVVEH